MRRRSFLAMAASLPLLPFARPAMAQTPVAVEGDSNLMALLRLLPGDAFSERGIQYADFAGQRAALGIAETGADIDPDTWIAAMPDGLTRSLAMPLPFDPVWREGLGFDLRDVDRMLEARTQEGNILLLAGQFDAASLMPAWEAEGYIGVETNGVTWYTLGGDNVMFDPAFPLSNWHVGMLSHVALLEGTTFVGTAMRADMERVLALHAGEAGSFGDGPGAALASVPTDLGAGFIVEGGELGSWAEAAILDNPNVPEAINERLATQAAQWTEQWPMPPIAMALAGVTAGVATTATAEAFPDAPRARAVVVAVPERAADATMVAEYATQRLTMLRVHMGAPYGEELYADLFPEMAVDVTADGAVILDLTPAEGVPAALLNTLLQWGMLSILYWGE